jgi:acyl-CoA reductase-like NAD-dependent aldehyde dehydrogenase
MTATRRWDLWIDGSWTPPGVGRYLASRSPATGAVVAEVGDGGARDVDVAVQAAQRAQPGWAALPPEQRARPLRALADLITARLDHIAALECPSDISLLADQSIDNYDYFDSLASYAGETRCTEELP